MTARRLLVAVMVSGGMTVAAVTQDRLAPAVQLYERAAFEEALATLEGLPSESVAVEERLATDHYRVLCLLALGRESDAETVMQSLIELHPAYDLGDDTSPRVRRLFDEVRRRIVPDLMRSRYADAKAHYDAQRFDDALVGFAVVRDLGTAMGAELKDAALRDLVQVAGGFHTLATAARAAAHARETVPQAAAPAPPEPAAPAASSAPVAVAPPPPVTPTDGIFGQGDAGITPPVPLSQGLAWRRGVPSPHAGAPLGTIEVIVDESGAVAGTRIIGSVSAFYDAILVESARTWRYRPALRNGQPVKFRRVVEMIAGR